MAWKFKGLGFPAVVIPALFRSTPLVAPGVNVQKAAISTSSPTFGSSSLAQSLPTSTVITGEAMLAKLYDENLPSFSPENSQIDLSPESKGTPSRAKPLQRPCYYQYLSGSLTTSYRLKLRARRKLHGPESPTSSRVRPRYRCVAPSAWVTDCTTDLISPLRDGDESLDKICQVPSLLQSHQE